jgi:hypothetical protein
VELIARLPRCVSSPAWAHGLVGMHRRQLAAVVDVKAAEDSLALWAETKRQTEAIGLLQRSASPPSCLTDPAECQCRGQMRRIRRVVSARFRSQASDLWHSCRGGTRCGQ